MVALNEKYTTVIKNLCIQIFRKDKVSIVLFGSRARGDFRVSSDIDLAVISDSELKNEISLLRERLEESTIPFQVDVVEFKEVAEVLKDTINKEGILFWKN